MVQRRIKITKTAAQNIASIAWFIGSKGMPETAKKYVEKIYLFLKKISSGKVSYSICRDKKRSKLLYKCVSFEKKFTIVFSEDEDELIIREIIASKNIK